MSDIFGNVVNLQDVPRSVEAHLKKWANTNIAAAERAAGITPPHYSRPMSWMKLNLLEGIPGEEMSPAIIIVTRGGNGKPEQTGRTFNLPLDIGIAIVTSSYDGDGAREVAGALGWSVLAAMIHRRNLDGQMDGKLRVISWDDVRLDDLAGEEARSRAIMRLEFTIMVDGVVDLGAGPTTPDPPLDPYPPPGDWPTVLTHSTTIRQEDDA